MYVRARSAAILLGLLAVGSAYAQPTTVTRAAQFPKDLVRWTPSESNPVFAAAGPGHWDAKIRERGWILHDVDGYHLWYTGYDGTPTGIRQLGHAQSPDGIHWTRSPANPLSPGRWIEDMMVVRNGDTYFMFAEGPEQSVSQMLTSRDGVHWEAAGVLDIRRTDGSRVEPPFGTPTVWVEDGKWYLFYERGDLGVWLATSRDPRSLRWVNVQDEPVLALGPRDYDSEQIAFDQVIKHRGVYYALYHASGRRAGSAPRIWSTNIARSTDLIHWHKYERNPIVESNKSSGILVPFGDSYRLYTMHDQVDVFEPSAK